MLLPPVSGCDAAEASPPPTTPTAGQAIPLLTHTPCYSAVTVASHRSRTSEPSYSSPRGHPLLHLLRLRVFPFLVLVIVHRPGALGAVWSMWSTTDFHQKSNVRGEADSWVHGSRKEVPPYYAENNYSSTRQQGPTGRATSILRKKSFPRDCWDPPDGPPYFAKKTFPPLSARTHRKCLLITHKKMNTPLAS